MLAIRPRLRIAIDFAAVFPMPPGFARRHLSARSVIRAPYYSPRDQSRPRKASGFSNFRLGLDTPDAPPVRDYTHVSDLADALSLPWNFYWRSWHGCIPSGIGKRQFHTGCVERGGKGERTTHAAGHRSTAPGDPAVLVADSSRAKKILNFKPKLSS